MHANLDRTALESVVFSETNAVTLSSCTHTRKKGRGEEKARPWREEEEASPGTKREEWPDDQKCLQKMKSKNRIDFNQIMK